MTISGSQWTNAGNISVSAGSTTLAGGWTNTGTISATGGKLILDGAWTNTSAINASNATVELKTVGLGLSAISLDSCNLDISGSCTTAQVRQISQNVTSLGVVDWDYGVLDNTGDVVTLSEDTGDFRLAGGTLRGGTIVATDDRKMICTAHLSKLESVCLQAPVYCNGNGYSHGDGIWAYDLDNQSTMTFSNGGGLALYGSWANSGSILVSNGYLRFRGSTTAQGNIVANNARCELWSSYELSTNPRCRRE